jgi:hypothetical protein
LRQLSRSLRRCHLSSCATRCACLRRHAVMHNDAHNTQAEWSLMVYSLVRTAWCVQLVERDLSESTSVNGHDCPTDYIEYTGNRETHPWLPHYRKTDDWLKRSPVTNLTDPGGSPRRLQTATRMYARMLAVASLVPSRGHNIWGDVRGRIPVAFGGEKL